MSNNLYKFIDDSGSFESFVANKIKSLHLPLCNQGLMSSISADLSGDIKSSHNSFLFEPASRASLSLSRASRNFWVYVNQEKIWSATGVSKNLKQLKQDKFKLSAGQLWQKVSRKNKSVGLKSEILSFVPACNDALEVMQVKLTNISKKSISFIPYAAIPMYARSADNLRDHRQVTSLLTRIKTEKYGIKVKPTLLFDESGHRPNDTVYFVAGCNQGGRGPQYIYPTQEIFCGDSGDLESPEAVFQNQLSQKKFIQGKEPMGALRFAKVTLAPNSQATYIILMGIGQNDCNLNSLINKFGSNAKVEKHFKLTKDYWASKSKVLDVISGNQDFDNWLRWVSIQPTLRKIFGCSFLPDFDYGKGGRGWRDLWQDCLGLIISNPQAVRPLLINNFCGVKIDGSNATIIGKNSGEFVADRNNISRVWMDHGVWPLITLDLYLQETGDLKILFEPATYFRNHQINRTKDIDYKWSQTYGNQLKTRNGKIYQGTILEHLLVQNLVQFYNVGAHNHIRLEGADWNDGLDMAKEHGESVTFSAMYAQNLETLAQLLKKCSRKDIEVAQELKILFTDFNYQNIAQKHKILKNYFSKTQSNLSGRKIRINTEALSRSLKEKSVWIKEHIRKNEWLKEGFFNGYYDNCKNRIDGKQGNLLQMTLTSQVFPIMSAVATSKQTKEILNNVHRYLYDSSLGGIRLNTDFKKEQHNFGRAFSFAYGNKENGAVFSHMVVMFAYALYKQGYAQEGWKVLSSLYKMATNTTKSKIYPCLPEYFDLAGQGMYPYLTGSASWFVFTLLTQTFGVRGKDGDLLIEPKLAAEQFKFTDKISINRVFANRKLKIVFMNSNRLDVGKYRIAKLWLNSEDLGIDKSRFLIFTREVITSLPKEKLNVITVELG
ncbi:MAG: cellobiose phosphorylase [Candidatus Omnitrophota bacterium]